MRKVNWSETSMVWLSQLCQFNPDAWQRYMKRRRPGVITIAVSTGVNAADAEAVANDVDATLYERMKGGKFTYDSERSFNGYLYKMARNKALDFLRQSGAQPLQLPENYEVAERVRQGWDSDDEEHLQAIQKWVQQLEAGGGGRDLEIWRATAVEGRPVAEVAQEHGINPANVYRAKYKITERFRELAERFLASDDTPL
jgi:RNA polymerase sigma factor (sigma-70 family)